MRAALPDKQTVVSRKRGHPEFPGHRDGRMREPGLHLHEFEHTLARLLKLDPLLMLLAAFSYLFLVLCFSVCEKVRERARGHVGREGHTEKERDRHRQTQTERRETETETEVGETGREVVETEIDVLHLSWAAFVSCTNRWQSRHLQSISCPFIFVQAWHGKRVCTIRLGVLVTI